MLRSRAESTSIVIGAPPPPGHAVKQRSLPGAAHVAARHVEVVAEKSCIGAVAGSAGIGV